MFFRVYGSIWINCEIVSMQYSDYNAATGAFICITVFKIIIYTWKQIQIHSYNSLKVPFHRTPITASVQI